MKKLKSNKFKSIVIIFLVLISSLLIHFSNLQTVGQKLDFNKTNDDENNEILLDNLKSQDLTYDNIYNGIGSSLNITHWANRTDYNHAISFINNSYDTANIPLGSGWQGYKLNSRIYDLSDKRNWCNGSFIYGDDNGYQDIGNDTSFISNKFQNWTFGKFDLDDDSDMAGNYLDSTSDSPETDDHDCLELKITGLPTPPPPPPTDTYGYDGQDRCYWTSSIQVPRGEVLDSTLKFDVRDFYLMESNNFELRISLNDQQIYSIGALSLRQACGGSWRTFSIGQDLWTNTSKIFMNPVNNSQIKVNFTLIVAQPGGYFYTYEGFENGDYQQLFIDNVELIIKATAKPTQIKLKMNNNDVDDINWGQGTIEQNNLWITSLVKANFTSDDIWELGGYEIELRTNLNLYARKNNPESNYETNSGSLGTIFSVINNSLTNWEFYAYFSVPTGYEENEMKINIPTDFTITWVSEPQDPSTNRLSECDTSTQGVLTIPVNTISLTPDGFWKFKATSPNYCQQINILTNATGSWVIDNQFLSGEYMNITAKISDSPLISEYIQQTKVQLDLRFPNGTIWSKQNQIKTPNANGYVYFDPVQIPNSPPDYEVGVYEAIITWNNSYSNFGLNETGIIYKEFTVIHESIISPDQDFFGQIIENEEINLKISFNDFENFDAIQGAQVYLDNFLSEREFFSEISPGYYLLEFNTTGGFAGNNTLNIYANSSWYLNNQVNITIEIIQETALTAQEYPNIQVVWNENFTIHLNYTKKSSGLGISTIPTNNWIGESYKVEDNIGEYSITFNSSNYEVDKFHSLIINFHKEGYESQSIIIGVLLTKRQTNISIYIDSMKIPELYQVKRSFYDDLSISVEISDSITDKFLSGGNLTLISQKGIINIPYTSNYWYNTSIKCSPSYFSLGLNLINIRFMKDNYEIEIFSFQLVIDQIEIEVNPIGFEDSITADIGESLNIQLLLLNPNTNDTIVNAFVSYSWEYGIGTINETTPGTYATIIKLPENLQGNYKFNVIITPDNSSYKTTLFSFIVVIGQPSDGPQEPNYLLWIIIAILISVVSVLGALSLRSYVLLPRKRKKEAILLSKTQRFRDLKNIQAIVVIHKLSGIPIYSQSYSILEKHKKELFSGFIQAITMIGEEFAEKETKKGEAVQSEKGYGVQKMIELNFKQFFCLIADIEDIRVVFILRERSSERLKNQVSNLCLALNLKLSEELQNWDGSLDKFEILIPEILNEYFELYYKDSFMLSPDINLITLKKEKGLTKMELRIINVIQSMSTDNIVADLNNIVELVSEENKSLIIEAIESLIKQKIIIPIKN
ncbi:MAG: hypothetical protein ACFFBP_18950 [Promethearchaeota archaeon]